ncbi:glycosyltransferase [Acidithiobacillus ferrooxidans]|uniref:glycosyltransferase n=1 Tax=Acidithiobacillus ferrooxidans TaxID=920 RepID=UPI003D1658D2
MNSKSLLQLYGEHTGKVSDKWSLYLTEYDRLFKEYRDKRIRLLEIGIQNGGSLEIWAKYFDNASALIGCDINPDCAQLKYDDPRIDLIIGDANDLEVREQILRRSPQFDLIIDDGSHLSSDIIESFALFFSSVVEGGVFIAEDLHCSYWDKFEGGLFDPYSSISFFKRLADIVNHEHWGLPKARADILFGTFAKYGCEVDAETLSQVHSVEFINSMCVIRKAPAANNCLGNRVIAGSLELVVQGHRDLHGRPYQLDPIFNQTNNPWAARTTPPDEEIQYTEVALAEAQQQQDMLKQQIAHLNQSVAERDGQIAHLNQSVADRDGQIAHLNQSVAERDGQIAHLNQSVADRDGQIAHLNQSVAERDGQIAHLNQSVADRDGQIAHLNQSVANRDGQIAALFNSNSWRITRPLRIIASQIKRIRRAAELSLPAIKRSGGLKNMFRKAAQLYRREGFEGIKRGFRIVATTGQNISTPDSGEWDKNDYAEWIRRHDTLTDESRASMRKRIEDFTYKPRISVVMPTYNPNTVWLIKAIESVRKQIYQHWELCIADDASTDKAIRLILERYAREDFRIKIIFREKNGHISAASNSALEIADGEWIALLDHDDLLSEHALFWVADTINSYPQSRLIYSDEDKLDERGNRSMPFFKPDWSPHLAISQAYLGHLVCYQKTLIETVGGFNAELNGAQDYGLALACVTNIETTQIQHIPRILYHWRMHAASTAQSGNAKPYAHEAGRKAVEMYIQNNFPGLGMRAVDGDYLFTYKAEFSLPANLLVSIIIPTKDGLDYLRPCVESIFDRSTWQNVEVLILDNGSEKTETFQYLKELQQREPRVRVIPAPIPFNWSKLNNIGVKYATGDVLIFLNNDTQVITHAWIESMAGYARLPNVGTVGALLLFEDGSIQHSGVVVGMGGWADHVFRTMPAQHIGGPFVSPVLTRNVLAVTGACLAISREKFNDLGGVDESFIICGSDVELGLRAHKHGLFNVMCAEAKLIHYESKTRTPHVPQEDFIESSEKYAPYRQEKTDPFYNQNLSLRSTTPSIQEAPRVT